MKKRKWVYVQEPQTYEISCDKCAGSNIAWSEYEHMIWCYDCGIDTTGNSGIFDGPVPVHGCEILGFSLDRYYIQENEVRKPVITDGKVEYISFCCPLSIEEAGEGRRHFRRGSWATPFNTCGLGQCDRPASRLRNNKGDSGG